MAFSSNSLRNASQLFQPIGGAAASRGLINSSAEVAKEVIITNRQTTTIPPLRDSPVHERESLAREKTRACCW